MLTTFTALAVTALALLPGALYIWGFERVVGPWGVNLSDRVLRFFGVSAVAHVLLLPITFWLWTTYVRTGRLADGDVPLWVWPLVVAYVGVPLFAGSAIGHGTRRGEAWAEWFTGLNPAPRAWDYIFGQRLLRGWVRLKLKSGVWIGGAYARLPDGRRSYAAGYPEPQDLFLVRAAEMNPTTGQFVRRSDGSVSLRQSSILIRWDEVEYMEFIGG